MSPPDKERPRPRNGGRDNDKERWRDQDRQNWPTLTARQSFYRLATCKRQADRLSMGYQMDE